MSYRKTHVDLGSCDMLCGRTVFAAPSVTCAVCAKRIDELIDFVCEVARSPSLFKYQDKALEICKRFNLRVEDAPEGES